MRRSICCALPRAKGEGWGGEAALSLREGDGLYKSIAVFQYLLLKISEIRDTIVPVWKSGKLR